MLSTLRAHWPEYAIEASCLAMFMISAAFFATLLQHPASPLAAWPATGVVRRLPMGLAMGLTAIGIIYSPLGARSGAHMNPAVTLTFLRLGKIAPPDAAGYVAGQFAGGLLGIGLGTALLANLPADPPINYVATSPGPGGATIAFAAEAAISFGLMLVVLTLSNSPRMCRFTGVAAGLLVCTYITLEEPLSGMSMNPARSFGPALFAQSFGSLWVYFAGPVIGMAAAAEAYLQARGRTSVRCAKLHHPNHVRCIFRCALHAQREVSASA
jgi:aquaporin Z